MDEKRVEGFKMNRVKNEEVLVNDGQRRKILESIRERKRK